LDETFMKKTLKLALKGAGKVSPNPMVGALIVKDGKVISQGYHSFYGGPHAEVVALSNAGEEAKGATLYVNLEPCVHFGKTPPCVPRIIDAGIKRVVVATLDPNPLVSGRGIKTLKDAGLEVSVGVLESEAKRLNEAFFKWITKKIPFVILKVASTIDGKIADTSGESKWITSFASRKLVHRLRAFYDAVLVGIGTILKDDPELTVRFVKGRNPVRVILDAYLRTPLDAKVLSAEGRKIIFHSSQVSKDKVKALKALKVELFEVSSKDGLLDLDEVLKKLGEMGIASLIVEGGRKVLSSFLDMGLVDKILYFVAPKVLGKGIGPFDEMSVSSLSDSLTLKDVRVRRVGVDILIEGYVL